MKKLFSLGTIAILLSVSSCGKTDTTNDSTAETSVVQETATVVDTAQAVAEEVILEEVNPEEALALTVASKNLGYADEESGMSGTWVVKVTNNSQSPVNGADYVVAYTETIEETANGEFVEKKKSRTAAGQDVAPGESVNITLKAKPGCQGFSNPKIKATK